jgi:hypothetical protein
MCCPTTLLPTTLTNTTKMVAALPHSIFVPPDNSFASTRNKRVRKCVFFYENVSVIPSSSPLDELNPDDGSVILWYQLEELEAFRNDARETCREMKYHDHLVGLSDSDSLSDSESSTHSVLTRRLPSLARDSATRGLEQRSCVERQRRKYLSNRYVLKVAQKLYQTDPEKLAEVSRKCNAWACELAIEEASRDYDRVYSRIATKNTTPSGIKRPATLCNEREPKRICR